MYSSRMDYTDKDALYFLYVWNKGQKKSNFVFHKTINDNIDMYNANYHL